VQGRGCGGVGDLGNSFEDCKLVGQLDARFDVVSYACVPCTVYSSQNAEGPVLVVHTVLRAVDGAVLYTSGDGAMEQCTVPALMPRHPAACDSDDSSRSLSPRIQHPQACRPRRGASPLLLMIDVDLRRHVAAGEHH